MCGRVSKGVQRCAEVRRGAWRCTEVCRRVHKGVQRCMEVHRGAQKGAQGGVQAVKGQVGKKAGPGGSTQVPRSWNLGKLVWWAHSECTNQTRGGLLGQCAYAGTLCFGTVHMVQIGWRPDTELNTDIPMVYKTPLGTSVEMHMCGWAAWWVV